MTQYDKLHLIKIITDTVVEIIKQSDSEIYLTYNDYSKLTDVGYALDGIEFLEDILIEKIKEL